MTTFAIAVAVAIVSWFGGALFTYHWIARDLDRGWIEANGKFYETKERPQP